MGKSTRFEPVLSWFQFQLGQCPVLGLWGVTCLPWPQFPCLCNIGPNYISETKWKLSQNSQNKLGLEAETAEVKSRQRPLRTQESIENFEVKSNQGLTCKADTETPKSVGKDLCLIQTCMLQHDYLLCSLSELMYVCIQWKTEACT